MRNVFSSDYVHAWTLLEACLEHGNFERAELVLFGLTEISGSTDITLAVNTYLQRLVDANFQKPYTAIDWLRKLEYQIPRFKANDATEALMLKNACTSAQRYPELLTSQIKKYSRPQLLSILRQFELLGAESIQKVLEHEKISVSDLDKATQKALNAFTKSKSSESAHLSGRMQSTLIHGGGKIADPIRKDGFDPLEPTKSPGLVGIRHILTGLQRKSQLDQKSISELADLAELPHVQNKNVDDVDFFDIWKQLETDEEKQKFDRLLEETNERRQRNVETRGVEAARMRWRQMFEQMAEADRSGSGKIQLRGLETLLWEWNQAMMPLVDNEISRLRILSQYAALSEVPKDILKDKFAGLSSKAISERFEYAPYLTLAKPENLPAMTMMELLRLNSSSRDSVRSVTAIVSVGKNVEREYKLEIRKRSMKKAGKKLKSSAAVDSNDSDAREEMLQLSPRFRSDGVNQAHFWPATIRVKIGSLLISLLMQVAKVPVTGTDPVSGTRVKSKAPAFHHSYQYQNGNKIGILRPHKVLANYLSGERTAIQPQQLPMLCKPRPWTSWNVGGYWYTPSTIIRSKDSPEQVAYIAAASERGQLQSIFDGLNVLGNTPWTVNKEIFKILSQIWNSKKEFLDIPPHVPPIPDLSDIPVPPRDSDPGVLRDYRRKCRAVTLENGRLYSQRCDLNYKLDIARALVGERFYMPHNIDFRGRAYPLSPHFNHLGNDVTRSLLIFWEGRKLGPKGLWWLKVHLANLFGVNKASHDERVRFVDENMEKVISCAEAPLSPDNTWWKEAEGPFQALATCMEIRNALRCLGGHENFESHLTVHQDGSCNGLQHYAALGGDFEGAREVNLEAAERPQDVYSRVLEIVKSKVLGEAKSESSANKDLANIVFPVLSRKVVKQTVMTHVYGVTYVGAREQIANRLRDIDEFPNELVFRSATYLAQRVLDAVRELFTSAHEIQDWLGDNATRITRAIVTDADLREIESKFVSSVIWTTPLGLPIVQPYRQEKRKQINTELQTVYITDPYSFQGVNARKQRMAFPPNYIHSLDASHMLMSALQCAERNISFAAVHDSYWTHAADVDILNKTLRERFVELHSRNLIEKLRDEFQHRYGQHFEVVSIPSDSEVGQRVRALFKKLRPIKYGRAALSIPDQVELELNRKPGDETPLDIMRTLSTEEIAELVALAEKSEKARAPNAHQYVKSTEHSGSGLDSLQGNPDADASEEASPKKTRSRRSSPLNIEVLVPLRIPEIPARGSFDVRKVLDSPYFFS